ncbi:hypothetical protein U0355_12960 [Salimicrobium sp. PL1-032A]|uniref:hypothetical protein n=1 Tax=Salimicrobium sp. PL1-032A TaxID=3095364 RepID=UPI0032614A5B
MEEERDLKFMAINDTKIWIRAVLDECNFILNLSDKLQDASEKVRDSTNDIVRLGKEIRDIREQERIREYENTTLLSP